jgi:hypothetical protein
MLDVRRYMLIDWFRLDATLLMITIRPGMIR